MNLVDLWRYMTANWNGITKYLRTGISRIRERQVSIRTATNVSCVVDVNRLKNIEFCAFRCDPASRFRSISILDTRLLELSLFPMECVDVMSSQLFMRGVELWRGRRSGEGDVKWKWEGRSTKKRFICRCALDLFQLLFIEHRKNPRLFLLRFNFNTIRCCRVHSFFPTRFLTARGLQCSTFSRSRCSIAAVRWRWKIELSTSGLRTHDL